MKQTRKKLKFLSVIVPKHSLRIWTRHFWNFYCPKTPHFVHSNNALQLVWPIFHCIHFFSIPHRHSLCSSFSFPNFRNEISHFHSFYSIEYLHCHTTRYTPEWLMADDAYKTKCEYCMYVVHIFEWWKCRKRNYLI